MARSKAYLFGGVEIRWSCAPSLIKGKDRRRRRRVPFPRRPEGLSRRSSSAARRTVVARDLRRQDRQGKAATARSNGRSPGSPATASSAPTATPSRPAKAARTRPGFRTALTRGLKRLCRAHRQQARRDHHRRRRHDLGGGDALGVHPRAGIRRPDQGPAGDVEATRIVENAVRDPFDHWLAASPQRGHPAARMGDRARRGAAAPPAGEGDRAQDRGAQAAPAGQARRLHADAARRHRALHRRRRFRRRLGQAGARPRHARRSCRCAARSSTSPAPAARSSPATSSSPT